MVSANTQQGAQVSLNQPNPLLISKGFSGLGKGQARSAVRTERLPSLSRGGPEGSEEGGHGLGHRQQRSGTALDPP